MGLQRPVSAPHRAMESKRFLAHSFFLMVLLSSSCTARNVLFSGERLNAGESLVLGSYVVTMQADCNLVFYAPNAIWSSRTFNQGFNCYAAMQYDGNFVVYSGRGFPLWSTGTNIGIGNYILILQPDRHLVVYGPARWGSGTYIRGAGGRNFIVNTTTTASPDNGKKH